MMKHVVVIGLSCLVRFLLFSLGSERWLSERVELSTPLDSWTRRNAKINLTVS